MNSSHNWAFQTKVIRKRIEERKHFINELMQNNRALENLQKRENKRAKYLLELIIIKEDVWQRIADVSSTTFSESNHFKYIRNYFYTLKPHLKFEAINRFRINYFCL